MIKTFKKFTKDKNNLNDFLDNFFLYPNFFSLVNIIFIFWLLLPRQTNNNKKRRKTNEDEFFLNKDKYNSIYSMKNYIDHVRFTIIKLSSLHNNSMNNLT